MKATHAVAGVLCLIGAVYLYGWSRERTGLERGRSEAQAKHTEELSKAVAKRDTEYVHTREVLRRTLAKFDTVRVTDTLQIPVAGHPDSVVVYIPRAVADTAVSMCLRTLSACDQSLRARDSLIVGLRSQLSLQKKAAPKRCGLRTGFGVAGGVDMQRKPNVVLGVIFGLAC